MSRTLPSPTAAPATAALGSAVLPVYADTSPAASGPPTTAPAGEVPGLPQLPTVPGRPVPSLPGDAYAPDASDASAAHEVSGPLGRDLRTSSAADGLKECPTSPPPPASGSSVSAAGRRASR